MMWFVCWRRSMMRKKASLHLRMPLKINMKKIISTKKVGIPTFCLTLHDIRCSKI